ESKESTPSLGIRLLEDLRVVFGDADALATETILHQLVVLEEAPWAEVASGKPLNARGLAGYLRAYGVRSKNVRVGEHVQKGYAREDFADAWARYLSVPPESATSATSATDGAEEPAPDSDRGAAPSSGVADVADGVADVADGAAPWPDSNQPDVADV